jgi:hypothetical protein
MSPRLSPLLLALVLWIASAAAQAEPDAGGEYELKAVFISKFLQYIAWPEDAPPERWRVVVVGDSPLVEPLREVATQARVHDRPLEITVVERLQDLPPCEVLVLSEEDPAVLWALAAQTAGQPMLTVGERAGTAQQGLAISFLLEQSRLRFEINPAALERAGLQASSRLLALAEVVVETPPVEVAP